MASLSRPLLLVTLLGAPLLAGCFGGDDAPVRAEAADWTVGDRWTYARTRGDGPVSVYHREVVALTSTGSQTVYEVREGIVGAPVEQTNRYTVGRLRYVGGELRDAAGIVQSTTPDRPIVYHYLLPLGGPAVTERAELQQRATGTAQVDHVEITASSAALTRLVLGERAYLVIPYRIEIRFLDTPFAGTSVIEGHWAPAVGQSVLTLLHEEGVTTRYELRTFERAKVVPGGPAYTLVGGLRSRPLEAGFDATLDGPGHVRYLVHVVRPVDVGLRFFVAPLPSGRDNTHMDLAVLRPLGWSGVSVSDTLDGLAEPGVVLHVAAADEASGQVILHTPEAAALGAVRLEPGQVYELLLASNRGGMRVEVRLGADVETLPPVARGAAEVVTVQHRRVQESTGPGPQSHRDAVTAVVSLGANERVEGLVYAINHGAGGALGEVEATRTVYLRTDAQPARGPEAIYASYQAHAPAAGFEVEAAFEYRASAAVQGGLDYEIGALLVRLGDGEKED